MRKFICPYIISPKRVKHTTKFNTIDLNGIYNHPKNQFDHLSMADIYDENISWVHNIHILDPVIPVQTGMELHRVDVSLREYILHHHYNTRLQHTTCTDHQIPKFLDYIVHTTNALTN